jgi:hypothetical protein
MASSISLNSLARCKLAFPGNRLLFDADCVLRGAVEGSAACTCNAAAICSSASVALLDTAVSPSTLLSSPAVSSVIGSDKAGSVGYLCAKCAGT